MYLDAQNLNLPGPSFDLNCYKSNANNNDDSVKELRVGYMTGALQNTYLLPIKWKKEYQLYQAVHKPLFGREFPIAWRDIDRLELPTS